MCFIKTRSWRESLEEAFYKRLEALVDIYIASYLWVTDAAIKRMESEIRAYAHKYLRRPSFFNEVCPRGGVEQLQWPSNSLIKIEKKKEA